MLGRDPCATGTGNQCVTRVTRVGHVTVYSGKVQRCAIDISDWKRIRINQRDCTTDSINVIADGARKEVSIAVEIIQTVIQSDRSTTSAS